LRTLFNVFDSDSSGMMETSEFRKFAKTLGTDPALTDEEVKEAMLQLDSSNNKRISFDEFWSWWKEE